MKNRYNNRTRWLETSIASVTQETKKKHNKVPALKWSVVNFVPAYSNISKKMFGISLLKA